MSISDMNVSVRLDLRNLKMVRPVLILMSALLEQIPALMSVLTRLEAMPARVIQDTSLMLMVCIHARSVNLVFTCNRIINSC